MPSKTVSSARSIGLHARPAGLIAEAAPSRRRGHLAIAGGDPVDAGSALMIMTLGAGNGDQVTVASDDQAAVERSPPWSSRT